MRAHGEHGSRAVLALRAERGGPVRGLRDGQDQPERRDHHAARLRQPLLGHVLRGRPQAAGQGAEVPIPGIQAARPRPAEPLQVNNQSINPSTSAIRIVADNRLVSL